MDIADRAALKAENAALLDRIKALEAGIQDIADAANSFRDESGDEVAGQVRLRCRALTRDKGGDGE